MQIFLFPLIQNNLIKKEDGNVFSIYPGPCVHVSLNARLTENIKDPPIRARRSTLLTLDGTFTRAFSRTENESLLRVKV